MKGKGVIVLAAVIIMLFCVVIALDYDETPLATLFAPPIPNQSYQPTVPSQIDRAVCIVFDDGWKSQLDAVPILNSFGFKATFAIVTSYTNYPEYMSWKDIRGLAENGMDIASHTSTHKDLAATDWATLYTELAQSQQTLRSRGYPANIFIYPYGGAADNQTVKDQVAKYYLLARGTVEGKCNLTSLDRYNLQAYDVYHDVSMEDFTAYLNDTGGADITILYYHKISGGNEDTAVSQQTFQMQMQYLKDNGYTVKTLSEIFLKTEQTS